MGQRLLCTILIGLACLALPARAASNLADYEGKYPSDAVGGVSFLQHPVVVAGVEQAVADATVRGWVLGSETVQMPIMVNAGVLFSQACEPHNCGDHTWTILMDVATGATDVCYYDTAEMSADQSRWYLRPGNDRDAARALSDRMTGPLGLISCRYGPCIRPFASL